MMSEKKTCIVDIPRYCGGLNLGDEVIFHGITTQLQSSLSMEITVFF